MAWPVKYNPGCDAFLNSSEYLLCWYEYICLVFLKSVAKPFNELTQNCDFMMCLIIWDTLCQIQYSSMWKSVSNYVKPAETQMKQTHLEITFAYFVMLKIHPQLYVFVIYNIQCIQDLCPHIEIRSVCHFSCLVLYEVNFQFNADLTVPCDVTPISSCDFNQLLPKLSLCI